MTREQTGWNHPHPQVVDKDIKAVVSTTFCVFGKLDGGTGRYEEGSLERELSCAAVGRSLLLAARATARVLPWPVVVSTWPLHFSETVQENFLQSRRGTSHLVTVTAHLSPLMHSLGQRP